MNKKYNLFLISVLLFVFLISISSSLFAEEFKMKQVEYLGQSKLEIDTGGTKIIFEENSDEIYISEGLKFDKSTDYI